MDRNELIAVIAMTLSIVIATLTLYSLNRLDIATKAGLEQCPIGGAGETGETIFVKSCAEYTELIKTK